MNDDLEFGPVELVLAAYDGSQPDPDVIEAIIALVDAGTVRLLDLVHVTHDQDGAVRHREVAGSTIRAEGLELVADGLVADEDIDELGRMLPPGSSALLLAVELVWAKHLASSLARAGGAVIEAVRIPAPAVNAVVRAGREAG